MELKDLIIARAMEKVASSMEKEAGLATIGNFAKEYAPALIGAAGITAIASPLIYEATNPNSDYNKRKRVIDYIDKHIKTTKTPGGAIRIDKAMQRKFDNLYRIDPGIVERGLKITGNNKEAEQVRQQFAIWQDQKNNPMYLK